MSSPRRVDWTSDLASGSCLCRNKISDSLAPLRSFKGTAENALWHCIEVDSVYLEPASLSNMTQGAGSIPCNTMREYSKRASCIAILFLSINVLKGLANRAGQHQASPGALVQAGSFSQRCTPNHLTMFSLMSYIDASTVWTMLEMICIHLHDCQ